MAQRRLHRLLLRNFFWQSQCRSVCHILLIAPASRILMAPQPLHRILLANLYVTIPMAQRVPSRFWKPLYLQCFSSYTRPSDQTQRPRLVLVKGPCSQPPNTLHPNAKVLATCPLDWRFPMEGRRYNLKPGRTLHGSTWWNASDPECRQKCKTKRVLHTAANNKLTTKAQRMQMKMQKQQSTAHNSKKWYMNYCQIWSKSSKYCGHAEWYDFSPSDTT